MRIRCRRHGLEQGTLLFLLLLDLLLLTLFLLLFLLKPLSQTVLLSAKPCELNLPWLLRHGLLPLGLCFCGQGGGGGGERPGGARNVGGGQDVADYLQGPYVEALKQGQTALLFGS